MIGIYGEEFDEITKKTKFYMETYKDDVKKLIEIINETNDYYRGKDLQFLFSELKNEIKNIKTINKILENYIDTLSDIKLSYLKQDEHFNQQINYINSKN